MSIDDNKLICVVEFGDKDYCVVVWFVFDDVVFLFKLCKCIVEDDMCDELDVLNDFEVLYVL